VRCCAVRCSGQELCAWCQPQCVSQQQQRLHARCGPGPGMRVCSASTAHWAPPPHCSPLLAAGASWPMQGPQCHNFRFPGPERTQAVYLAAALRAYVDLWPAGAMSGLVASLDPGKLTDIQYLQQALKDADAKLQ
jgi:hypothetical protein